MPDEKKAIENFTQGLDNITHGMKDGCSIVRALGGDDEAAVAGAFFGGIFGMLGSLIKKK
uniref:Uncharacterized protein n=1 Tax=Meloidogyne incognita TaxID=6306 RepID=A0A914KW34_MELIC